MSDEWAPPAGQLQTLKYLGRGSSAIVSQCSFTGGVGAAAQGWQPPRLVAKKVLHAELMANPECVATFLREVKLLRELQHKFIVQFYENGASTQKAWAGPAKGQENALFYLQEFMAGGTLHALVLRAMGSPMGNKVYSDADALRWALQIAEALEYLHSQEPKVIHRDLKLENILLSHTKPALATAKLADFGLARRLHSHQDKAEGEDPAAAPTVNPKIHSPANLTAKTGSMGYMAPEVLQGKPYNEKADVFSFAIILYNLFHRDIPTVHVTLNGDVDDLEAYAHQVAHGYRPPMKPYVHQGVAALIERCWKGMPELRPTMAEVAAALRQMQGATLDIVAEAPAAGAATVELAGPKSQRQAAAASQPKPTKQGGCCTIM